RLPACSNAAPDPFPPRRSEPGPGLQPFSAAIGRKEHEARFADEVFHRDEPDALLRDGRETTVERVVAIVAHQEQHALGNDDRRRCVLRRQPQVEYIVADASRQRLAVLRVMTGERAVTLTLGKADFAAALVGLDRQYEIRDPLLRDRLPVQVE